MKAQFLTLKQNCIQWDMLIKAEVVIYGEQQIWVEPDGNMFRCPSPEISQERSSKLSIKLSKRTISFSGCLTQAAASGLPEASGSSAPDSPGLSD